MSKYWSTIVKELAPYVPGEQPKVDDLIKLNTNENPYGPSPEAVEVMAQQAASMLRLYPDPNADLLKDAIAEYYDISGEKVFVGNGSDEILAHTFQAFFQQNSPLLFPDISYSFYPVYCGLYRIDFVPVPLGDNLEIQVNDYKRENGGILFPNPNAPTGRILGLEEIEAILQENCDTVVAVDEAYIDFGGESAVRLLPNYDNLLVIQTLSKSRSLAGLRVGFALGHKDLIEALDRVKNSFNSYPLDRFAIFGAAAAMRDRAHFEATTEKIIATREVLTRNLTDLGFEVIPSSANFVFVRNRKWDAGELSVALRQRKILVRHFRQQRIDQFLRITVGTDDECAQLVRVLSEILGS